MNKICLSFQDVSAIHVFLQIVMENIDKDELNVLGILNDSGLVHPALAKITNEFNGISIHYKELSRKILITKKSKHLADADLVVVRGMTTDSCVRIFRVYKRCFSNVNCNNLKLECVTGVSNIFPRTETWHFYFEH